MKNKTMKKTLATLLVATMCMGSVISVCAADNNGDGIQDTKAVAITKELDIAEGITTPTVTFTFTFAGKDNAPAISAKTLKFVADDTQTDSKIIKETTNVLSGVTFPHAGIYTYTVAETAGDVKIEGGKMEYDTQTYTMTVAVKNGDNGPEVDNVVITKGDQEPDGSDEAKGAKVDGAPTDKDKDGVDQTGKTPNGDDQNTEASANGNGFRFTNTFTKNGGGVDPEKPDPGEGEDDKDTVSALKISKTVMGDYGDKTLGFEFPITLTKAATTKEDTATGYIVGKDGKVKSSVTFTYGTENTITLAHGEYLNFQKLPAGTKYSFSETEVEKYTATTVVTADGKESKTDGTVENALVGEKVNSSAVTNTYDDDSVTPAGILVNNMPFIAAIVVILGAVAGMIISKKRRFS